MYEGKYVHELFYLLTCLMPTLDPAVSGDQRILPLPDDQDTAMCDTALETEADTWTFDSLMKKFFQECPVDQAVKALVARQALCEPLGLRDETQVNTFLRSRGFTKHRPANKYGYLLCYERNERYVWLKMKDQPAAGSRT